MLAGGPCLLLTRAQDYFFWTPGACSSARPFVCATPPRDVGCYDAGAPDAYRGPANVTQLGFPCIAWNHPDVLKSVALPM